MRMIGDKGSTCGRDRFPQSTPPFTASIVYPFPAQGQTGLREQYTPSRSWPPSPIQNRYVFINKTSQSTCLARSEAAEKLKIFSQVHKFTSSSIRVCMGNNWEGLFNRLANPSIRDVSVLGYHTCKTFGNWRISEPLSPECAWTRLPSGRCCVGPKGSLERSTGFSVVSCEGWRSGNVFVLLGGGIRTSVYISGQRVCRCIVWTTVASALHSIRSRVWECPIGNLGGMWRLGILVLLCRRNF
jgi:hypothetical protein